MGGGVERDKKRKMVESILDVSCTGFQGKAMLVVQIAHRYMGQDNLHWLAHPSSHSFSVVMVPCVKLQGNSSFVGRLVHLGRHPAAKL